MAKQRRAEIWVPGRPATAGSKRVFVNKKTGRPIVTDDCKRSKPWRDRVAAFAMQAHQGKPMRGPLELEIHFYMPRPKYHYRTGKYAGQLKDSAPYYHTKKPDATKLLRAAEDALTSVLWEDDSQITKQTVHKTYVPAWATFGAGAEIKVLTLD